MRVELFKDSEASFIAALEAGGIPYQRPELRPGFYASGTFVTLATVGLGTIATIVVAWLKARPTRKVIITTKSNTVIHVEAKSVDEVKELLAEAARLTAFDTEPANKAP